MEGPPIPITIDMVKKAISQMKASKASGIVVEMIRAAGDMGASMIRDLAAAVIQQSFIVCLYKGKGDAMTWQLQSSSRVSLSVSTRVRGMHWKRVTTVVSS